MRAKRGRASGDWSSENRLRLKISLEALGVDTSMSLIQKSALLGSARILRRVSASG